MLVYLKTAVRVDFKLFSTQKNDMYVSCRYVNKLDVIISQCIHVSKPQMYTEIDIIFINDTSIKL